MAEFFYFISTLPLLSLHEDIPMTSTEFLTSSSDWLEVEEQERLEQLSSIPAETLGLDAGYVEKAWHDWETCLRNYLTEFRAGRLGCDASEYAEEYPDYFSEVEAVVQEVSSIDNPLEQEKKLDAARWKRLQDMEPCHEFDFEMLCIYKLKLLIAEKWQYRDNFSGKENLREILNEIYIKD